MQTPSNDRHENDERGRNDGPDERASGHHRGGDRARGESPSRSQDGSGGEGHAGHGGGDDRWRTPFTDADWEVIRVRLGLSPRETDVVRGLFAGKSEAGVAHALDIAASTVHEHVRRIYAHLGLDDRRELVLRVYREYVIIREQPGDRTARPTRL